MCNECNQTRDSRVPRELQEKLESDRKRAAMECGAAGQLGRAMSDAEIVAELFKYQPPTERTQPSFTTINQAAKNFAEVVLSVCPRGMDRTVAINYIRLARMLANAAVALNGLSL